LFERQVSGRLVDAPLQGVLRLQLSTFRGDQPQHDHLVRWHEPQRGEATGALVVIFEEEPVHRQFREHRLGHEIVRALGRPRGAEVAPAHVGGDRESGRFVGKGGVELLDVAQVLVLRVVPALREFRSLRGVVKVGQAGIVELQVRAPELGDRRHLRRVRRRQVGPELIFVRVDRGIEGGPPAPVVDHRRRGDGELGGDPTAHARAQEHIVLAEDGLVQPDRPVDLQGGGGELDVSVVVVHPHPDVTVGLAHPAEAVDEIHVPGGAPELAIGGRTQPDIGLHRHHVPDGFVLNGSQLVGGDPPLCHVRTGLPQHRWPQQTADVVGPQRWALAQRHEMVLLRTGRPECRLEQ
jgi:hypothetical protein